MRAARTIATSLLLTAAASVSAGAAPLATARPLARSARTITIIETGHLHLTSHHGFTLNEQGTATGTIAGKIYIHLNVASTDRVTAEVNIYPSGGSLTGNATAGYRAAGSTASFSGTMKIARGSGSYNHATGSGLTFSGSIQRETDAVTVHVAGRIST